MSELKEAIARRLVEARSKTLWLLDQVPDDFLRRRVHTFYSPIGWHFGHIGRTEEWWVSCEALQRPCLDEHLSFLLADTPDNPKDNRVSIPDRIGLKNYLADTREIVLEALDRTPLDPDDPYLREGYVWEFAHQHECQHQETIAEMLCLIHQRAWQEANPPEARVIQPAFGSLPSWSGEARTAMVKIEGGAFTMGSDASCGYDNEKGAHEVEVGPFSLAEAPVTAKQWSLFVDDHGYHRPEFWSQRGWEWRCEEDATLPEYWIQTEDAPFIFSPAGLRPIDPTEPASSISWHEAEAYCMWAEKRLPTEAEWEFASSGGVADCAFSGGNEAATTEMASYGLSAWGPEPARNLLPNPNGIRGMAGGTWEWTSSAFLPYPGFEAFPYEGYSADHMKGEHRVCRGGSFATAAPILRRSFRNWYVPGYRQGFLGLRCAE